MTRTPHRSTCQAVAHSTTTSTSEFGGQGKGALRTLIPGWFRDSAVLHMLLLALSILVCFYGLWNAYFWADDYWMLGAVRHAHSFSEVIVAELGYGIRLVLDSILWLRTQLFGLAAAPYYWTSLCQHLIVTLLVYWLAASWTRHRTVALLTALLFGTTFSHYSVITWITGSNYSLITIPYLCCLACFAAYLRHRTLTLYLGVLATLIIALLAGEVAVSLPLVLLAYHLTLGQNPRQDQRLHRRDLIVHLPFWVLFALYLLVGSLPLRR